MLGFGGSRLSAVTVDARIVVELVDQVFESDSEHIFDTRQSLKRARRIRSLEKQDNCDILVKLVNIIANQLNRVDKYAP